MNMRLLAEDLSLGRSFASSTAMSKDHDPSNCRVREQFYTHPMSSDLHALEVYHKALEDERLKIQAFERELPFCMQLLDDAIEASKEQLEERLTCKLNTPLHEAPTHHEFVCKYTSSLTKGGALAPTVGEINLHFKRKWTCSLPPSSAPDMVAATPFEPARWLLQKTTSPTPTKDTPSGNLLELKECSISDRATPQAVDQVQGTSTLMISSSTKSMANCPSHLPHNALQYLSSMRSIRGDAMTSDKGALHSLDKVDDIIKDPDEKRQCIQAMPASMPVNMPALINGNLSSPNLYSRSISIAKLGPQAGLHINTGMSSPLAKAQGRSPINLQPGGVQRKPRRCWSPELHQRFLTALKHLGGCQVATPKQIRELMNVEGLTNDEVKSHLQKFRLHMRRPNGVVANAVQSNSPQTTGHHLLVFGHIWVPPEYDDEHHQQYEVANLNMHTSGDLPNTQYGDNRELQLGVFQNLSTNNIIERDNEEGDFSARAASINIEVTPAELDNKDNPDQHKMLTNVSDRSPQADVNLSDIRTHACPSPTYLHDQGDIKQLLHLIQARDDNASAALHTLKEREPQAAKIADFKEFSLTMGCSCTESTTAGAVPTAHAAEDLNQDGAAASTLCNITDNINRTAKVHHHEELIA